jgi:hypothetical protein
MKIAEQIVDDLLEGRVGEWFADKWNDVKVATGIGHDSFGLGKAEKGFKPKYGSNFSGTARKKPIRREAGQPPVWKITP